MQYRLLGSTGLTLSVVGFGVWTVSTGWWGHHSDNEAVGLLRDARDLGITFFDTADTYGEGRGETLVGEAFAGQRDRVIIGTKFGYDWETDKRRDGQREHPQDFSPEFVRRALEASLRRLQTDYIDLYQLHNPRLEPLQAGDLFELLDRLKAEGKIRAYGAAMGPAIGWRDEGVYAINERHIPAIQVIHNLLEQDPGRDFLAAASAQGAGVIARVPHSSGLLEGKYTLETTFAAGDHRQHRKREWLETGLKKLEQLGFVTETWPGTIGEAALQWLWADPQMASALPNIYDREQLSEFAAAADLPDLPPGIVERINALYDNNFALATETVSV